MKLTPEELYVYNEQTNSYQVPQGDYIVQVGGASDKLPLKTSFTLAAASPKPDLQVVNIRTMPVFPKVGEPVFFMASLINNGTCETKIGDNHLIRFYVDGKEVANYYSKSITIPVGGMEQACAQGLNNMNWIATAGKFNITAKVEVSKNKDLIQENNTCEGQLIVPNGKVIPIEIAKFIQ